MTGKAKIWTGIAIAIAGGFATLAIVSGSDDSSESGKERPDTPEGRRGFAQLLAKDLPADSMWTEGAQSEILVVDLKDCTPRTLSAFVQGGDFAKRLWQFDFAEMRCTNGVSVHGPWEH